MTYSKVHILSDPQSRYSDYRSKELFFDVSFDAEIESATLDLCEIINSVFRGNLSRVTCDDVSFFASKFNTGIKLSTFTGCRFVSVDFNDCTISNTSFNGCIFKGCRFINTDLQSVFFDGAEFINCKFIECEEFKADFSNALIISPEIDLPSFLRGKIHNTTFSLV